MKLTTEQLKEMIKKELDEMVHSNDREKEDIRSTIFNAALQAAHIGMDLQQLLNMVHEGYGHGEMESEGDIEDDQTYVRGPYGEM